MKLYLSVESAAVDSLEYNSETEVMTIRFKNNKDKKYDYYNVPLREIIGFMEADSKGRYFHHNLRKYSVLK